ncbi:MAG: response regulator transcription factor [Oscillospiraceae bacterium]|nr:response regulator transcription factor [Oscillospiraceae bacterium]
MRRIYAVEDDDNIRELLVYALSSAGFEAAGFADGSALFSAVQEREALPDLIILDIMLPGEDGVTILKRLKAARKTAGVAVIILSAKGSEYDRVKGLDLGADDYITKPFSVIEAISRVKAVLRRAALPSGEGALSADGVVLNEEKRRVFADGKEIPLTYKEFELLRFLMLNKGIVLSRDRLLDHIWGYDFVSESRTVDMHIKSIRQKLGDCGGIIKTVRSVGYKVED